MSSRKSLTTMFSVDILKSFTSSNLSAQDRYPQRMTIERLSTFNTFEIFDLDLLIRHDLLYPPVLQLKLLLL